MREANLSTFPPQIDTLEAARFQSVGSMNVSISIAAKFGQAGKD